MNKVVFYEEGFWWWYDRTRKGYYIGPSPYISTPTWSKE